MKFIWSDKNPSINTTLSTLYIFAMLFLSAFFAFILTIIFSELFIPTSQISSGHEPFNKFLFFGLLIIFLGIFAFLLFAKKYKIIKYTGMAIFLINMGLLGYISYVDGGIYALPAFLMPTLLTSAIIWLTGDWKEKNKKIFDK